MYLWHNSTSEHRQQGVTWLATPIVTPLPPYCHPAGQRSTPGYAVLPTLWVVWALLGLRLKH